MANFSSVFPNNHQVMTMRPIIKSQQSVTQMNSMSHDNGVPFNVPTINVHSVLERRTMIQLNYLYYGRMAPNILPLNPYLESVNRMPVYLRTNSPYRLPPVMTINENAVRLDDIDEKWYATEEDALLFPYRPRGEYKVPDYADIDLLAIHQEAQKYNEYCQNENVANSDYYDGEYRWDRFLQLHEPIILNQMGNPSAKLDYDYLIVNPFAVECLQHYFQNIPVRRMPYTRAFERNQYNM